jgi:hypothetical protein
MTDDWLPTETADGLIPELRDEFPRAEPTLAQ